MISSLVIIFSALAVLSALMCSLSPKIIRTTFIFGVTLFLISFVFISIGSKIGVFNTIVIILITAMVGIFLVRRQK